MIEQMLCLGGKHHGTVVEVDEDLPILRFPLLSEEMPWLEGKGLEAPSYIEPEVEEYHRYPLRFRVIDSKGITIGKRLDFFVHESVMNDPEACESTDIFVINQLVDLAMAKGKGQDNG